MNFTKPLGPFAILYEPRNTPAPAPIKKNKYKTKKERAVIALETPLERRTRHAAERQAVMAAILRKNPYTEIGLSTVVAGDRAAAIRSAAI